MLHLILESLQQVGGVSWMRRNFSSDQIDHRSKRVRAGTRSEMKEIGHGRGLEDGFTGQTTFELLLQAHQKFVPFDTTETEIPLQVSGWTYFR